MASGETKSNPKPASSEDDFYNYPSTADEYQEPGRKVKVIENYSRNPAKKYFDEETAGPATLPSAPWTMLQLRQPNQIQHTALDEASSTSNAQDLTEVRERLRNMIENIRRFIPLFEDMDLDLMNMDELQSSFWELGYLERALLDPEDYFEYVRYDDLEYPINSRNQETSSFPLGEQVTTECLVCYEVTKLNKRICCDFAACGSCIVQYIETNVNEGVVKVGCIGDTCDAYIYRDEIIGRLPATMKDKYYRFLVDANKDPKVKTCPRCSNIHHLSEEDGQSYSKYGLPVTCPECRFHWCFECQAPWHAGIKCKDFKRGDKQLKQWAKEKHFGETNAQKCPKCKIFIERRGGCDHMTCSKCDTSFCYRCGGRYIDLKYLGNHLSQYSPVGCKYNLHPDRPGLRRFIRGSVLGAKLLGGVLLLGIGVAAVGVLCGASVVIVPAFVGYKYHRHRKFKRQLKRHQELIKMRSNNAMMELHRERERNNIEARTVDSIEHMYTGLFDDDGLLNIPRGEMLPEARTNTEPIHIGIQTGQSQQVDVTVHNPYRPDVVVNEVDSHNSEIRMNITDDRGQVTVTTAEISHNSNGVDGSEAEIVLHVRTSYPKTQKSTNLKDVSVATSEAINEDSDTKKSDAEVKSAPSAGDSVPKDTTVGDGQPKSAQIRRRVHSTGSLKKTAKKQEFGSISRKWRLKPAGGKSTNDESDSPTLTSVHDQGHMPSLQQSEDSKHLGDNDQNLDKEGLTQSGCFITLFGKKLNTLQNHIEKDKVHSSKSDSSNTGEKITCPDIVSCALAAEKKKDNADNSGQNLENIAVEKDKYLGLVSTENSTTAL